MPSGIAFSVNDEDLIYVFDSESDNVDNPGFEQGIRIGDALNGLGEILHSGSGWQSGHHNGKRCGIRHGRQVWERLRRRATSPRLAEIRESPVDQGDGRALPAQHAVDIRRDYRFCRYLTALGA